MHQSLSIDVDTLPNEILIEIFLACVETVDAQYTLNPYSAPWVVASVCRRWRNICLAIPVLWSRLPPIVLDEYRQGFSLWHLGRALALSSPERLDLSLFLRSEKTSVFPFLHPIIPHLDRCRSLALTVNDRLLAELAGQCCNFPEFLGELRLTALPHRNATIHTDLRIVWSKLTHLTLEYISFPQVYAILQNTTLLQTFCLRKAPYEYPPHIPGGPIIRLNHLSTWSFEWSPPLDTVGGEFGLLPAELLDRFTLPSLSTLLSNFTGKCDTYTSLMRRSQCSITHLRAKLKPCSPEEMLHLLGALPTVRVLEVVMDGLLSLLDSMELFFSTPIQSPVILPSLQHLKLDTRIQTTQGSFPDNWNMKGMLEQFVHSRTVGLLSCILGDRRDSVELELLERVSLYLPATPFKTRVFWHLTGRPANMNEDHDAISHTTGFWELRLDMLHELPNFEAVMSPTSRF